MQFTFLEYEYCITIIVTVIITTYNHNHQNHTSIILSEQKIQLSCSFAKVTVMINCMCSSADTILAHSA